MNEIKNKMKKQAGFTLAELLIVVAIIAVLVAIAIPIFTTQLEKSKEATDTANVRSAYADVMAAYITDSKPHSMTVSATQGQTSWQNADNGKITTQIDGKESIYRFDAKVKPNAYTIKVQADSTHGTVVTIN